MYLQKVISRKTFLNCFFVGVLKVNNENRGSGSESGSISQRHGYADPDPHQKVMDPEHWLARTDQENITPDPQTICSF